MFKPHFRLSGFLLTLCVAGSAMAQDTVASLPLAQLTKDDLQMITRNGERASDNLMRAAFTLSPDGRVRRADFDRKKRHDIARHRGQTLGHLLENDLDGDGTITASEIEDIRSGMSAQDKAGLLIFVFKADLDKDGDLSFAEISAHAAQESEDRALRYSEQQYSILTRMDIDGDGVTTLEEITQVVNMVLGK